MSRRLPRALVTLGAAVLLVLPAPVLSGSQAAASAPSDPESWARGCSAPALGLGEDTVSRAPVLNGDRSPSGGPVVNRPDATGKWYPIVLVHGWTSSDTVADPDDDTGAFSHRIDLSSNRIVAPHVTRSLIGQLQGLPGAAVFTFDYHPYSARWVDDKHLGPALGMVIDCLYRASGQKVVLLAHSMGGLISRWAATHPGITGADRSGEISTVVTFGTPETGSVAALLAAVDIDLSAATSEALAFIHLILSACGRLSSREIETGTVCDKLPAPARTFESDAGIALRAGSGQLAALLPWPKGIFLEALAGDTSFEAADGMGWFQWPSTHKVTGAGDMIVTSGSALAGAGNARSVHCDYQLSPARGVADQFLLRVGLIAKSDVALQPLGSFGGACFHTSLMRDIELTNEALGAVHDDLSSRAPPTPEALRAAPVPSLCGHRPGTLVNGTLPNIPASQGSVELAGSGRRARNMYATGDLDGDGTGDAAAVLQCSRGGVGWPDWIVFYRPGPKIMGAFDMGSVVGGARDGTTRIAYRDGKIVVDTLDARTSDTGCCPTGRAVVTLRWNGRKIVADSVQHLTGPTDITFTGIGNVHLGMSRAQLTDLGYTGSEGAAGCWEFSAPGKPYVTWGPQVGVVRIYPTSGDYQTAIGGIKANVSLLASVDEDFTGYPIERHLHGDFGQGSDGVLVHGPGGVIGIGVGPPPGASADDSLRTVTSITVGDATHAGSMEVGCN
jgi:pimeloyl-ACP methyl ester carboxylesterase